MKCKICNKPQKENTDGNTRYCQGHGILEAKEKARVCHDCGYPIDEQGFCTAPLSVAD